MSSSRALAPRGHLEPGCHGRPVIARSRPCELRLPKHHGSSLRQPDLLLEMAMGVGLLLGARLAWLRHFRAHAWCQSVIVLLNLAMIVFTMIPSFRVHVSPKIPPKLSKAYYALASAHAALGTIAEIAGLYILLAAGTRLLPEKIRMTNYKLWMRSVLILWWVVLLLGFATYARWYVPHFFRK